MAEKNELINSVELSEDKLEAMFTEFTRNPSIIKVLQMYSNLAKPKKDNPISNFLNESQLAEYEYPEYYARYKINYSALTEFNDKESLKEGYDPEKDDRDESKKGLKAVIKEAHKQLAEMSSAMRVLEKTSKFGVKKGSDFVYEIYHDYLNDVRNKLDVLRRIAYVAKATEAKEDVGTMNRLEKGLVEAYNKVYTPKPADWTDGVLKGGFAQHVLKNYSEKVDSSDGVVKHLLDKDNYIGNVVPEEVNFDISPESEIGKTLAPLFEKLNREVLQYMPSKDFVNELKQIFGKDVCTPEAILQYFEEMFSNFYKGEKGKAIKEKGLGWGARIGKEASFSANSGDKMIDIPNTSSPWDARIGVAVHEFLHAVKNMMMQHNESSVTPEYLGFEEGQCYIAQALASKISLESFVKSTKESSEVPILVSSGKPIINCLIALSEKKISGKPIGINKAVEVMMSIDKDNAFKNELKIEFGLTDAEVNSAGLVSRVLRGGYGEAIFKKDLVYGDGVKSVLKFYRHMSKASGDLKTAFEFVHESTFNSKFNPLNSREIEMMYQSNLLKNVEGVSLSKLEGGRNILNSYPKYLYLYGRLGEKELWDELDEAAPKD